MDIINILSPLGILGGMGLIFGVGLGFASKKFAVKTDPKVPLIRDALPGANCGGCGYAGCDAYAKAVASGEADVNSCSVGGKAVAEKLASIMGTEVVEKERTVAMVKCNGTCSVSKQKYNYEGILDCRDAALIPGAGPKGCSYGCLGLGSCVKACPFGAISIQDGIAVVDSSKCTSCGTCVSVCPKNLIELVPAKQSVHVKCNSHDKGKEVKSNCEVGCIGCRMCVRSCPQGAIDFENNLAKINYDKCISCGICAEKCPTGAIISTLNKTSL